MFFIWFLGMGMGEEQRNGERRWKFSMGPRGFVMFCGGMFVKYGKNILMIYRFLINYCTN